MRGNVYSFEKFIEGRKSQLVIPVYQRNYDWLEGNCDQLFDDLVKLSNNDSLHFLGSIVTTLSDDFGQNKLVIDGQQRITTISLLLLAGIKAVNDGKLCLIKESRINEAQMIFLRSEDCSDERKIKLVPIETDRVSYDKIYNFDEGNYIKESKMTVNFLHFYKLLTQDDRIDSFDTLLNVIERLQIIWIELEKSDDAQLIFESLNSTGLDLTEADKIRNYLLMSLNHQDQMYCYKEYWQKIEDATNFDPTMFLRDYLTIQRQSMPPKLTNLYSEWKKYMFGRDRKEELSNILALAKYYQQITTSTLKTERLSEKMRHIRNLDTDLVNVFFIQFLKYADEYSLPEDDIFKVIDLVENYFARRIVIGLPSNSLTQIFCSLHKEVMKNIEDYRNSEKELTSTYSEIMTHYLLRREGKYVLPGDAQFVEAIKTRDVYHITKQYQIFLFERLENSIHGEVNDVVTDMKKEYATIEHIMPQTLNSNWVVMLGENYEQVHEKYLHTFANLTLTGINSELSNKPYEIKREGTNTADKVCPGYKDSKYRLTQKLVSPYEKWTEIELEKRAQDIVDIFLNLYPFPQTNFKPILKADEMFTLEDEDFSPVSRKLKGFRLFDVEYPETKWITMMLQVIDIVYKKEPYTVDSLFDAGSYFWTQKGVGNNEKYCTQIAPDRFVWTSMDNKDKLRCLRYLFEKCNIAESELTLLIEAKKENE